MGYMSHDIGHTVAFGLYKLLHKIILELQDLFSNPKVIVISLYNASRLRGVLCDMEMGVLIRNWTYLSCGDFHIQMKGRFN